MKNTRIMQPYSSHLKKDVSSKYVNAHSLNKTYFSEALTHLRYLKTIQKLKEKYEQHLELPDQSMSFIALNQDEKPVINSLPEVSLIETDVIPQKNNIELMISKGIKVMVEPQVPSDKLIKIIELLKDL